MTWIRLSREWERKLPRSPQSSPVLTSTLGCKEHHRGQPLFRNQPRSGNWETSRSQDCQSPPERFKRKKKSVNHQIFICYFGNQERSLKKSWELFLSFPSSVTPGSSLGLFYQSKVISLEPRAYQLSPTSPFQPSLHSPHSRQVNLPAIYRFPFEFAELTSTKTHILMNLNTSDTALTLNTSRTCGQGQHIEGQGPVYPEKGKC